MSKISEQKALEAYPPHYQKLAGDGYFDMSLEKREGYIQGYDQAFQDFLEKAERWLEPTFKSIAGYNCGGDLINDFKKYIQDEM